MSKEQYQIPDLESVHDKIQQLPTETMQLQSKMIRLTGSGSEFVLICGNSCMTSLNSNI